MLTPKVSRLISMGFRPVFPERRTAVAGMGGQKSARYNVRETVVEKYICLARGPITHLALKMRLYDPQVKLLTVGPLSRFCHQLSQSGKPNGRRKLVSKVVSI